MTTYFTNKKAGISFQIENPDSENIEIRIAAFLVAYCDEYLKSKGFNVDLFGKDNISFLNNDIIVSYCGGSFAFRLKNIVLHKI